MAQPPQVKVVILGESSVGKTCIVIRFAKGEFKEESTATLGATFLSKVFEIPSTGQNVKFQIWDTAGQEKYRSLAAMYYQDAAAAILVYDITKKSSFDGITYWIGELKAKAPEGIKIAIAANKSDLVEKEEVNFMEAKKFAADNHAIFKSTSAKDGSGINEIFAELADALGLVGAKKPVILHVIL
jgi:small GTP-binding protein